MGIIGGEPTAKGFWGEKHKSHNDPNDVTSWTMGGGVQLKKRGGVTSRGGKSLNERGDKLDATNPYHGEKRRVIEKKAGGKGTQKTEGEKDANRHTLRGRIGDN